MGLHRGGAALQQDIVNARVLTTGPCTSDVAMTPQVSVVMPVRNGARWLGEAIESVLSQTFGELELVIIDDGSTDDTPCVLDEYARRDGRVRVIAQPQLGLASALNRGVGEVGAEVIARLDADDRMQPERIERQIGFFRAHPETALLGSWAEKIDQHGRHLGWLRPQTRARELIATLQRTNSFIHSSIMVRSEIVRRLGGYRPAFKAAEDYDLWLRIAEVAPIATLPETLVQYRRHGGNVTTREQIRQAFSARLAQSSAKARRETGIDPANGLAAPPDWNSASSAAAFFSSYVKMYRLLDVADPSSARWQDHLDFSPIIDGFDSLSHAERKLAMPAMINYIRRAKGPQTARTRALLLKLVRIRPGQIVPLARSILDASFARSVAADRRSDTAGPRWRGPD